MRISVGLITVRQTRSVSYTHLDVYKRQEILKCLLKDYNDGRRKSFFCLAVNLLDLEDLKTVMEHLAEEKKLESLTLKEKSAYVVKQFQSIAEQRGVVLKWNRKPSKPKK